ncbi:MAG TPA: PAS domain-containing protein [Gemmatimonadaceae bacterium]|nr:PAS domain-containing protein [Gemmatimonadaceae bacterium]
MENELSRVVDDLPGLVWTALPDGQMDFVNQRWCEYTGLSVEAARGSGWQTVIFHEDLPGLLDSWQAILASGHAGEMEARLRRFDGEHRWFLLRARPSRDASGELVGWCGINTEIQDRPRAYGEGSDRWWLSSRARENHFRFILDELPVLISLVRPTGEIECANSRYLDYFGLTLGEAKRRAGGHGAHPADRAGIQAAWRRSLATGEAYDLECRRRSADGVYRWFHSRGFPLRDARGDAIFWYFLQTDIDDLKRAGALLAGEKNLLEMVATGAPMKAVLNGLCEFIESTAGGCHCSIVLADRSGTHIEYGAAPSLPDSFINSILGLPVTIDAGPCAMAMCVNEQVASTDLTTEARWTASGWCSVALAHGLKACLSTPIPSTAGRVLGAFALYYDEPRVPAPLHQSLIGQLTNIASIAIERAQSDATLRRSEAFLAQGQQLSRTGTFAWRVAAAEIIWSDGVYHIFGFDTGVPVTLDLIASRVHPEDLPMFADMLQKAQSEATDFEYEHRLLMPDGSIRYLHMLGHATRDGSGRLEYIGAVQDVTDRRLSEDALSKARSELAHMARVTTLGALTASIAHEVNQPLSGIITNASTCLRMLAANPPNVDGARETARRTIRDGNRASEVITRLRALFSKKEPTAELVNLNEATREVIALSLHELRRSGVILRPEFDDGIPPVTGDRVQLQQVILNLLLNASDAMRIVNDRPRQLLIKTACDDDSVRLTVKDVGVGLRSQGVDRVFEAFYTTKSDGMGIGLSVSRSIIESHHGRLWAVPNDGPGATFSFSIPRDSKRTSRSSNPVSNSTDSVPSPQHVMRAS